VRYNGNPVWTQNICGDGGWTAIEPSNDSIAYTFCQGERGGYLFKTTDGGATWSAVDSQILAANDRLPFVAPVAIDPSNGTASTSAPIACGSPPTPRDPGLRCRPI
jgi:hypothetical protein